MTTALITGATRGLGRALALDLARSGVHVIGTGTSEGGVAALQAAAGDLPLAAVQADLTDPADNAALAARLAETGVDVVVQNAGVLGPRVRLADYPLADFERVMAVNVTGAFDLARQLDPRLNDGATVIWLSSGVGVVGRAAWGAYCVSKWAVEGLARTQADELRDRGVKVFIVDPGSMRTEMRAAAYPQEDPMTLVTPEENLGLFRWLIDQGTLEETGRRWKARDFRERGPHAGA